MGQEGRTMFLLNRFIKLLQSFILRRESAFRGCVYDEEDFAFIGVKGDSLAFLCWAVVSALSRGMAG